MQTMSKKDRKEYNRQVRERNHNMHNASVGGAMFTVIFLVAAACLPAPFDFGCFIIAGIFTAISALTHISHHG